MPSTSGGALRPTSSRSVPRSLVSVSALDVGRGVATSAAARGQPSGQRFYALDVGRGVATRERRISVDFCDRFYALDVGRGVATFGEFVSERMDQLGFYALDVGRGVATAAVQLVRRRVRALFLCPRRRAGRCDGALRGTTKHSFSTKVSMPSTSGGALRHDSSPLRSICGQFLCPRRRAGRCDAPSRAAVADVPTRVSMPSTSVYALDVGRGVATRTRPKSAPRPTLFLCPRRRAGRCDPCGFWWAVSRADAAVCAILARDCRCGKRHPAPAAGTPMLSCTDAGAPTVASRAPTGRPCTGRPAQVIGRSNSLGAPR